MIDVLVAITVYSSAAGFICLRTCLFFPRVSAEITKRFSFFFCKLYFFLIFVMNYLVNSSNIKEFQADISLYVN